MFTSYRQEKLKLKRKEVKIQKCKREVPKEFCFKAHLNEMHHSKASVPALFTDILLFSF